MKNSGGKVIEGNFKSISEGGDKVEDQVQAQLTMEQMKAALDQEKARRQSECGREIAEVLRKYNCDLGAQVVLRQGSVTAQTLLIVKD